MQPTPCSDSTCRAVTLFSAHFHLIPGEEFKSNSLLHFTFSPHFLLDSTPLTRLGTHLPCDLGDRKPQGQAWPSYLTSDLGSAPTPDLRSWRSTPRLDLTLTSATTARLNEDLAPGTGPRLLTLPTETAEDAIVCSLDWLREATKKGDFRDLCRRLSTCCGQRILRFFAFHLAQARLFIKPF